MYKTLIWYQIQSKTGVKEFSSNFGFDHLDDSQITALRNFLYDNTNIFATKQSPDLGFTDLVQHKIISATRCQTEIPKTISFDTGQERGTTASSSQSP